MTFTPCKTISSKWKEGYDHQTNDSIKEQMARTNGYKMGENKNNGALGTLSFSPVFYSTIKPSKLLLTYRHSPSIQRASPQLFSSLFFSFFFSSNCPKKKANPCAIFAWPIYNQCRGPFTHQTVSERESIAVAALPRGRTEMMEEWEGDYAGAVGEVWQQGEILAGWLGVLQADCASREEKERLKFACWTATQKALLWWAWRSRWKRDSRH